MPTPAEYNIEGKVFVAIGAGRGIGRGIVEVFAEAGAEGAVVALTPTYVLPLAERLTKDTGQRISGIVADGTRTGAVEDVIERVRRDFGQIDIWVNSLGDAIRAPVVPLPQPHGMPGAAGPLADDDLRHILDVNLTSMVVGCRAIGRYFVERGRGRIINIGSFAGRRGGDNIAVYTAAKAGVEGLTRALALEWAPHGVTVNCISPGRFPEPEALAGMDAARVRERAGDVPLGRVGRPREVGLLALYLASDASAYMTGQSLYLDGGLTL